MVSENWIALALNPSKAIDGIPDTVLINLSRYLHGMNMSPTKVTWNGKRMDYVVEAENHRLKAKIAIKPNTWEFKVIGIYWLEDEPPLPTGGDV
ncbi:hypothetical protein [Archaeoglobus neptunius]|uniref:hypothetical protein n=1 Tax=Archaeoglobus neptunius TaxID=2798580 RepID=UPI0019296905|nr:hypothetical protein [Archaeoglobus neptunius]